MSFFDLSKLLAPALSVETWLGVLALLCLAGLFLGRITLAKWAGALGFVICLVLGFVPLGEPRVAALESVYDPPKTLPDDVSGIILLSGSEQRGPSLRWGDPQLNEAGDRVIATARLARALPQTEVIITGGAGHR